MTDFEGPEDCIQGLSDSVICDAVLSRSSGGFLRSPICGRSGFGCRDSDAIGRRRVAAPAPRRNAVGDRDPDATDPDAAAPDVLLEAVEERVTRSMA